MKDIHQHKKIQFCVVIQWHAVFVCIYYIYSQRLQWKDMYNKYKKLAIDRLAIESVLAVHIIRARQIQMYAVIGGQKLISTGIYIWQPLN